METTVELPGELTTCAGVEPSSATFYPVVDVRRDWALVAQVDNQVVFFITDDLPPISGTPSSRGSLR